MARISTHKYNLHEKAVSLLAKTALTLDEKHFVLEHFHEAANNNNGKAGAFFTPLSLAQEFVVHAPTPCKKGAVRILDLCAGIGALSFCMARAYEWSASESCELVCVELNPDYVAVGKKVDAVLQSMNEPLELGFTNCGHPVGSAIALENIAVIEDEGLVAKVQNDIGPHLKRRLAEFGQYSFVSETDSMGVIGAIHAWLGYNPFG